MSDRKVTEQAAAHALLHLVEQGKGRSLNSKACADFVLSWWSCRHHFAVGDIRKFRPEDLEAMRVLVNYIAENPARWPDDVLPGKHIDRLLKCRQRIDKLN